MRGITCLLFVCLLLHSIIHAESKFMIDNPLQFLENFGINTWDLENSIHNSIEKTSRKEDSPIYYIKVPTVDKFYSNQLRQILTAAAAEPVPTPMYQLDMDFLANGKPQSIYHWKYKPNLPLSQHFQMPTHTHYAPIPEQQPPPPPPPASYIANEIYDPMELPPVDVPILAPNPYVLDKLSLTKAPISYKKYLYNGKPSGMYIWKPRKTMKSANHKHSYFKHFNY